MLTVPAVPDRITAHAQMLSEADAKAEAVEASFRRRTLDEVYGYDADQIARLSPHAVSPARLAGL